MTEDKLFGWSKKKWFLFFALQMLVLGAGIGFASVLTLETGLNPLSFFSYGGQPTVFLLSVRSNGTDIIDSGGSKIVLTDGQIFNLSPGCYQVSLTLDYLQKQVSVSYITVDPRLC